LCAVYNFAVVEEKDQQRYMDSTATPSKRMQLLMLGIAFIFLIALALVPIKTPTLSTVEEPPQTSQSSQETNTPDTPHQADVTLFKVARVVDGDTIELETGEKVRYIGMDTPETVKPNTPIQCFGKEASVKNKELVEGKMVRLEKDVSETDRYGRLLRYVYAGDIFVNDYLVRQGYAKSSTYPPDVKYQNQFKLAETEARNNYRGLWGLCKDL
jgi:endonuclease YncB( thermonuclease family)